MKRALITLAAALCATHASAGNFYVGGAAGTAHYGMQSDWMAFDDSRDRAHKIVGGYQLLPMLGLEMGYAWLGESRASMDPVYMRFRSETMYVALTGTVPLSPAVAMVGKIGTQGSLTRVHTTVYADSFDEESNAGSPMVGLGFKVALGSAVSLVAEYEFYGLTAQSDEGEDVTVDMASVGLHVSF